MEIAPWVSTKSLDIPSQMTPYLLMKQKGVIVLKNCQGSCPLSIYPGEYVCSWLKSSWVASEQALRGTLVAGWEKEGELATMSLEFEYLHRKCQCEMLIGRDDISKDVITLYACFHVFFNVFYIHAGFRFELISGNLTAQSMWSHWEIGGRIQISETYMWL